MYRESFQAARPILLACWRAWAQPSVSLSADRQAPACTRPHSNFKVDPSTDSELAGRKHGQGLLAWGQSPKCSARPDSRGHEPLPVGRNGRNVIVEHIRGRPEKFWASARDLLALSSRGG